MSEATSPPQTPFVGRESELYQLHQILKSVAGGRYRPKFVLIRGDVGVGKTALVERFLNEVSVQNPSVLVGQSMCSMETENNGLVPFSQLLASLAEKSINQGVTTMGVFEFAKEVAPAWLDILSLGTASKIVSAATKTIEEGKKLFGRSDYSQENVFVQFTNLLKRLSEKQTVVGFIDDLHWGDASSLRLLFHLARNLRDCAVMLICTYRTVNAMGIGSNSTLLREVCAELIRYGTVEIEIQQGIDVVQYVSQRYPFSAFPSDFIVRVQQITDGHALFVSQLFSLWEETEVISILPISSERFVWALTHEADFSMIPHMLDKVLDERIRLLAEDLREVLRLASVEGVDFTAQVIARIREVDEDKTYDQLDILQKDYRFIESQGTRQLASVMLDFYRFVHRFLREHVYNHIIPVRRRDMHRKVGECLEALYSDRSQVAGQLAFHFFEAPEPLKAIKYALVAARFEQSRYAWSESEVWCKSGLSWVDRFSANELLANEQSLQLRLDLLECSGDGFYYSSQYSLAETRYTEALAIAEQLQAEADRIAAFYLNLADLHYFEGRAQQATDYYDKAKQILLNSNTPFAAIHVTVDASSAFMQGQLGNGEVAVLAMHNILDRAEKLPLSIAVEVACGDAYNMLGVILGTLGRYGESLDAYRKALEIGERIDKKLIKETALLNIADNYARMFEMDQSTLYAEEGLKAARTIGDLDGIANYQSIKGEILLAVGKPKEAIDEIVQAIDRAEQIGSVWNMPFLCADLAMAYLALGDLEAAHQQAKRGAKSAEDSGQFELGLALDVLARIEVARHEWNSATQHFNQAIEIHQKAGHRHFLARTRRHYAHLFIQQGEKQEAEELLRISLSTFTELGLLNEADETKHLLEEIIASTTS